MSVLDKNISYFPSTSDSRKGISVNLLKLLQSNKHQALITTLRAESDPEKQGRIKDSLPCYTVAGTFSRRCEDGLLLPSGLAAVDLDSAEDYDVIPLLHELRKIPYIAYAGLSCRGKRIFAIIPFLYPEKYSKQYDRLTKSFEDIGLPMGDTCHKAISQPRYISYNTDETCFFNHNAKPYHLLPPEKTHHFANHPVTVSNSTTPDFPENPFKWCEIHFRKNHSFIEGGRHKYIIGLARYCNTKGLPGADTLSGCLANYNTKGFDELEITKIIKHIYSTQSSSHNTNPFKPPTLATLKNPKQPSPIKTQTAPNSVPQSLSLSVPQSLTPSLAPSLTPSLTPLVAPSLPHSLPQSLTPSLSPSLTPSFIPPPPPPVHKHDYIGKDGLIHIYMPGIPELDQQ